MGAVKLLPNGVARYLGQFADLLDMTPEEYHATIVSGKIGKISRISKSLRSLTTPLRCKSDSDAQPLPPCDLHADMDAHSTPYASQAIVIHIRGLQPLTHIARPSCPVAPRRRARRPPCYNPSTALSLLWPAARRVEALDTMPE